jgi:biotin carboxyl carrier protein
MAGDAETLARLVAGELRELLQTIQGTDVEELELEVSGTRLFFKRSFTLVAETLVPVSDETPEQIERIDRSSTILAERVGFFHYAGEAEAAHLKVDDPVAVGQVLGIIDSLGVPVPVQAGFAGHLEEMLVEEGQPVEFGQPLFVVRPDRS